VRARSLTSRRRRFHGPINELPSQTLRYMTEVDYHTHLALLAEVFDDGRSRQVAEARWVRRADETTTADFALAVADDYQRCGLGSRLLQLLQSSAFERDVQRLCGEVLVSNQPMIACMRRAGWGLHPDSLDDATLSAEIDLAQPAWREAA
jgi:acetyltransferase